MDWGTVGVIAGLLALQSGAFGLVLHWLHQDLVDLRGEMRGEFGILRAEIGTVRGDVHRLEVNVLADYGQRISRLEAQLRP
jgi:hypothetical protein